MKLVPYIFCHEETYKAYQFDEDILFYDCTRLNSHPFFELLEKLDQASFGGQGMGMQRWTFYDCGAMPGVIYGYAIERENLNNQGVISELGFDINDHKYLPISMFIVIPKVGLGNWFAHNLCSIGGKLGLKGLGGQTKVDALNNLKVENLYGATQWGSSAIHIHSQIADLELISAYTPNHSYPATLTYRCQQKQWSAGDTRRVANEYDRLIESNDQEAFLNLQKEIESGLKIKINGRPISKDNKWFYPLSIYK